ncbi:CIA30 family protein [Cereibacter sphaeroides]|uniref:CIA30 family protein n=1 Tax=Cereibacter sphaeroides TaxID=1063 RepID=UPI001F2AD765|nr:CIA30 family protein [Cereibacter sphaeroides]MCE6967613.1 CIA30 family protein [Cereibacter sphaeroides]
MPDAVEIIDDLSSDKLFAVTGSGWALISDRVMGGVSAGSVWRETVSGRPAIRMRGGVSLENNGGFLQIALDLGEAGAPVDASAWTGIKLDVIGNGQTYNLHLRTTDIQRPWESYRQSFTAPAQWTRVYLPFSGFIPHRTERSLRTSRLRRVGLVAIGREFEVDVAIGDIRFYGTSAD